MAIKPNVNSKVAEWGRYVQRLWHEGVQSKISIDDRNRNNYAVITGHQHALWNAGMRHYDNYLTTVKDNRIHMTLNKTRTVMEAREAFIIGEEPSISVDSDSPEMRDKMAAGTAQRVAKADWEKHDIWNTDIKDVMEWTKSCGESFIQVYYNPGVGKFLGYADDKTPVFEGEVEQRVRSSFETIVDPLARNFKSARYVLCGSIFAVEDAKDRFPDLDWENIQREGATQFTAETQHNLNIQLNSPSAYASIGAIDKEGKSRTVLVIEYWGKPTKEAPRGRYLVVVGGQVAQYSPLEVDEIPLIPFYQILEAGSLHGDTPVTEMRPMQENLNDIISLDMERSMVADLIGVPSGWPLKFGGKALVVGRINPAFGSPVFVPGGTPRQDYLLKIRYYEEKLEELGGVSSVAAQSKSATKMSGRSMYIVTDANIKLLKKISERFNKSVQKLVRLRLKYINKFYTEERTMGFMGETDRREIARFVGADIGNNYSVKIRLIGNMDNPEQRSQKLLLLATQSPLITEQIMTNPTAYKKLLDGIDKEIAHELFSSEQPAGVAEDENYDFSQGNIPEIKWWHDDAGHLKEHMRQLRSDTTLEWDEQFVMNLEAHTLGHLRQDAARKRYEAMQMGIQGMLAGGGQQQQQQGMGGATVGAPAQLKPPTPTMGGAGGEGVVRDVDTPLERQTAAAYPGAGGGV